MKFAPSIAALSAALALTACGLGAPKFPTFGETAYRIEGMTTPAEGSAPVRTVIYRDGPRMRVETTLPNIGAATIVFNEATNAAYVLTEGAPVMAATGQLPVASAPGTAPTAGATPAAPAAAPATPAAAPPPAAPTGVAVRVPDAVAPKPLEAPWAALGADGAQSTGACNVAGEGGRTWQPKEDAQGVVRTACITDDGIVLEVREGDAVLFQATSLQRGAQPETLFGVPPGYTVIDQQAIMQGVGAMMEQFDSVTGAPKMAPAPAAPAATPAPRP